MYNALQCVTLHSTICYSLLEYSLIIQAKTLKKVNLWDAPVKVERLNVKVSWKDPPQNKLKFKVHNWLWQQKDDLHLLLLCPNSWLPTHFVKLLSPKPVPGLARLLHVSFEVSGLNYTGHLPFYILADQSLVLTLTTQHLGTLHLLRSQLYSWHESNKVTWQVSTEVLDWVNSWHSKKTLLNR